MLRRLAGPIRVLALLIIVLMGNAGHHAAMAATVGGHHATSAMHDHHDPTPVASGHGASGTQSDQCCAMGQCLIGIAPAGSSAMLPAVAAERPCVKAPVLSGGGPELPFRPPA